MPRGPHKDWGGGGKKEDVLGKRGEGGGLRLQCPLFWLKLESKSPNLRTGGGILVQKEAPS